MAEQDRLRDAHLARVRAALAEGLAQADRGELLDGDDVLDEMRATVKSVADPSLWEPGFKLGKP